MILTELNDIGFNKDFYSKITTRIEPAIENQLIEEKYESGQLKVKGRRKNGLEHGTWIEWYENGQKKSQRTFINGLPFGTWKEWDEKGKLVKKKKLELSLCEISNANSSE